MRRFLKAKNSKYFSLFFLLLVGGVFLVSGYLSYLDLPYSGNDVVRQYQFTKFSSSKPDPETIILGDSSAGNAINAKLLTELSGQNTVNLALTGSFGLVGSYNMLRQAMRFFPQLKKVVILQSENTWNREILSQAYFDTAKKLNSPKENIYRTSYLIDMLEYRTHPKEIYQTIKYILRKNDGAPIDFSFDYIEQNSDTYSNQRKIFNKEEKLSVGFSDSNKTIFKLIGEYCRDQKLQCVFAHGPILEDLYNNSSEQIQLIHGYLESQESLIYLETDLTFPISMMGDTQEHIDTQFKDQVTQMYFERLWPLFFEEGKVKG